MNLYESGTLKIDVLAPTLRPHSAWLNTMLHTCLKREKMFLTKKWFVFKIEIDIIL